MTRSAAFVGTFLIACSTVAFADGKRGSEAFAQGNYPTASREWREAAAAGDADAMLGVGTLYDTGHGEPQNFGQALSWYRRAAAAGSAQAMFNVGAMYDNGRGTQLNRSEAIRWYAMSAARGDGRAAYVAATAYRDGDGVPQNTAAAIRFFKMAAAAGINAARGNLASLGKNASATVAARSSHSAGTTAKPPALNARYSAAANNVPAITLPKLSPLAQDAPMDDAIANEDRPPSSVVPPAFPAQGLAEAESALTPAEEPAVSNLAHNEFAAATSNAPVIRERPSGSPSIQVITSGSTATEIERFHGIALQRANLNTVAARQYDTIGSDIVRRSLDGDEAAQYDAGFVYERGIGTPPDLIRAYVYFTRATTSPDVSLQSAAIRAAYNVGGQLTEAQLAAATDMLSEGTP